MSPSTRIGFDLALEAYEFADLSQVYYTSAFSCWLLMRQVCRNQSLFSLMDKAENFPAESFASYTTLLDALKRLSLQSSMTPAAALEMASFVEASAKQNPQQGHVL